MKNTVKTLNSFFTKRDSPLPARKPPRLQRRPPFVTLTEGGPAFSQHLNGSGEDLPAPVSGKKKPPVLSHRGQGGSYS
jgi:hypothetical protein